MVIEINKVHLGDARELLKRIEKESISLSFWSPPYHVGKAYEKGQSFKEWKELLKTVILLHFPIIKPGGFLVINIGDILVFKDKKMPRIQASNPNLRRHSITKNQIIKIKNKYPDWNRYKIADYFGVSEQTIDRRLNGNNIRGGKKAIQTRVKLVGGIIEEFGLESGLYLYDRRIWVKDPAWANSQWHNSSFRSVDESEYLFIFWKPGVTLVERKKITKEEWASWGSRGVWNIPSVRANDDHEAKFPHELARRVIKLYSRQNDIVLDCFMGSGTTAVAAIRENRNYIGIELLEKYVELSRKNISKEKAKKGVA